CGIRAWEDTAVYEAMKFDLRRRYRSYTLADMVRGMDEYFPGAAYSLTDLFLEERRRVLRSVITAMLERHEETYRRIWEENRKLIHYVRQADAPIPDGLGLVARHVLEQEVAAGLAALDVAPVLDERVVEAVGEARALGLRLDLSPARRVVHAAIDRALAAVAEAPTAERVAQVTSLIEGANRIGAPFGLWATQNRFYEIWSARPEARAVLQPLAVVLGFKLASADET
ncbi:MAG TPA: hypothetical protein VGR82_04625, partial [Methylomirabilota bacterium]|nr:hypothetical protein [Methylomirabilota bacterium]